MLAWFHPQRTHTYIFLKNLFGELKCIMSPHPTLTPTPPPPPPTPKKRPKVTAARSTVEWFPHQLVWPDWTVQWFLCVDWKCLSCSLSRGWKTLRRSLRVTTSLCMTCTGNHTAAATAGAPPPYPRSQTTTWGHSLSSVLSGCVVFSAVKSKMCRIFPIYFNFWLFKAVEQWFRLWKACSHLF